jgi:alpha-tubulin suppressor-like RCC1 family protein/cation transport regulator ChaC
MIGSYIVRFFHLLFFCAFVLVSSRSFIITSFKPKMAVYGTTEQVTEENGVPATPQWDPVLQIYVGGVVPENAEVQSLIERNDGYLRLFGYGSLCWNPGAGALAKPGVVGTLGRARGYKRCWAQKSTDHRGRPEFPGIVCTLLADGEVDEIRRLPEGSTVMPLTESTMTEGVIYLIPPDLVRECLEELDFREKGGYARDVIEVEEDETGETHQALLYRGTPDNPAIWQRALLDLPFAAAIISVSEGPSGKNDVYLNSLDRFLSDTHTIAAENDDTTSLASMARYFQAHSQLFFLFGSGSNQHNQLLLDRPNNAAMLTNCGEDAQEQKEIVLCTPDGDVRALGKPAKLYAGGGHSGLLTEHGDLYLWGWSDMGQCASSVDNSDTNDCPLPVIQPLSGLLVESAALGFNHTLVIEKRTGTVYAFGSNDRGQVTGQAPLNGSNVAHMPTTPDRLKGIRVVAVAAGLFHSAVLTDQGELMTFGSGQSGQVIATADTVGCWKPNDGSRLVSVACGRRHTIVSDDIGRIWTLGENKYGQLGRSIGGKKFDATPTIIEGIPLPKEGSIVRVDCGWSHCVVSLITTDGETVVFGWGRNDKGQLGLGTRDNIQSPVRLFEDLQVDQVACGSEFTMVVDADEQIMGCGWNEQ